MPINSRFICLNRLISRFAPYKAILCYVLCKELYLIPFLNNLLLMIFFLVVYLLKFHQSAMSAGAILAMTAAGLGVGAQISGRMYDRVGPRTPTLLGFTMQIGASLGFAFSSDVTPLVLLGVAAGLSGLGMGLWNDPNSGAMLGATPPAFLGVWGGAFTHVTRTLGSVVGQALAAAIVTGVMSSRGFDIPLGQLAANGGAGRAFKRRLACCVPDISRSIRRAHAAGHTTPGKPGKIAPDS